MPFITLGKFLRPPGQLSLFVQGYFIKYDSRPISNISAAALKSPTNSLSKEQTTWPVRWLLQNHNSVTAIPFQPPRSFSTHDQFNVAAKNIVQQPRKGKESFAINIPLAWRQNYHQLGRSFPIAAAATGHKSTTRYHQLIIGRAISLRSAIPTTDQIFILW